MLASIERIVRTMEKIGLRATRRITKEDIVYVMGEFKLHSPDMFSESENEGVGLDEISKYLRNQIENQISSEL